MESGRKSGQLTDESGTIAESYEYDAWGKVLSIKDGSGNVLSQSAIGNRYMWQGREYDADTGLYYFRARWYNPETGRWLSKDPIGIEGGYNLYVFCENNPVNYVDPYGEVGWVGAAVGAVGGLVADVGMQYVASMASGEEFGFSDIDWKSAGVSAGVGAATGALGVGALGQSKKAITAVKTARHMQRNLRARQIAMAAGKFRNPAKTAQQLATRNQAIKNAAQAFALGTTGPVSKQLIKGALPDGDVKK